MKIKKMTVDLNAYISDLECVINTSNNKKQLSFSFKNRNYGIIAAIRLSCVAYDSFGDRIQFDGKEFLEIKKADLQIEPLKSASFTVDVDDYKADNYDVKKVEVSVKQLVYVNGEKLIPKEPRIVEYEVEVLSSSWSIEDHFEKDALSIMEEKNNEAICFPKIHPEGWICVCGILNSESENNCTGCGDSKQRVFSQFDKDLIKAEIEKREKEEREEAERRVKQQETEQEKKRKKKMIAISAVILAIVIGVAYAVTKNVAYNKKYGLSEEEKIQYNIAKSNYVKIYYFVLGLGNDFNSVARKYSDDDYSYFHERKSRMRDAEKDEDYLYARGIYLAAPLLYDLIEDQYPEKYRSIYVQLVKLRKSDVYNDILVAEKLYVENGTITNQLDTREKIDKAIDSMETYMNKEILNPAEVEIANTHMPTPDYSKVYGINLGILYYEDGSIRYVGEVSNGKANGYGECWYSLSDGGGTCCEGIFEDGIIKSADNCYNMEGNSISANELSNIVIAGDFEMVHGLKNTMSSKAVAQKNADDEERDISKAGVAVQDYLDNLLKKQSSITKITWIKVPDIRGNQYFFSCVVEYGDLKRGGTVTVKKNSDGTFKATGLSFND